MKAAATELELDLAERNANVSVSIPTLTYLAQLIDFKVF